MSSSIVVSLVLSHGLIVAHDDYQQIIRRELKVRAFFQVETTRYAAA
jgi:hypothetical protein